MAAPIAHVLMGAVTCPRPRRETGEGLYTHGSSLMTVGYRPASGEAPGCTMIVVLSVRRVAGVTALGEKPGR